MAHSEQCLTTLTRLLLSWTLLCGQAVSSVPLWSPCCRPSPLWSCFMGFGPTAWAWSPTASTCCLTAPLWCSAYLLLWWRAGKPPGFSPTGQYQPNSSAVFLEDTRCALCYKHHIFSCLSMLCVVSGLVHCLDKVYSKLFIQTCIKYLVIQTQKKIGRLRDWNTAFKILYTT